MYMCTCMFVVSIHVYICTCVIEFLSSFNYSFHKVFWCPLYLFMIISISMFYVVGRGELRRGSCGNHCGRVWVSS